MTAGIYKKTSLLKAELTAELKNILSYWINHTQDTQHGGFYGKIDNQNRVSTGAPKGSVLNARILWSFSAAFNLTNEASYLEMADRAYRYITAHIIDKEFGGVYWTVDACGNKQDPKKQVYACAFTIYALSEYYKATKLNEALEAAINMFGILVEKSFDREKTGYLEAFTQNWQPMADLRLSDKDANEKKTMNTHLHVLEGFTNLYRAWPDEALRSQILLLLKNFLDHFINHQTNHLELFFDEDWNCRSTLVSYGHDIEATWLLIEAAEVINAPLMAEKLRSLAIAISDAVVEGVDTDGGLFYEYEPADDHLIKEKHWWPQAEALVGFINTWQISGNQKYLDLGIGCWDFIKAKILDKQNGEWFWGIDANGQLMQGEDKAGLWKCPYHNSRACMEIMRRLSN